MSVASHHVQIAIPSGGEEAAVQFYGDLLGLEPIAKPTNPAKRGGVWFSTGTLQLHLGVDREFVPARKAHAAFEVFDLNALRTRLEEVGITVVEDEPLEGFDRFYVSDPFGNRVECLSARDPGDDQMRGRSAHVKSLP